MKKIFSSLLICMLCVSAVHAQDNYLEGAVPEVDGKVVFSKKIEAAAGTTSDNLYEKVYSWANERYLPQGDNRLAFADKSKHDLACVGLEELDLGKGLLSRKKGEMSYQLIMRVDGNVCNVELRNVVFTDNGDSKKLPAEEMITDRIALNKDKSKLNAYYDKFRIAAIDFANSLFASLAASVEEKVVASPKSTIRVELAPPSVESQSDEPNEPTSMSVRGPVSIGKQENSDYVKISNYTQQSVNQMLSDGYTLMVSTAGSTTPILTTLSGVGSLDGNVILFYLGNQDNNSSKVTLAFYKSNYADALHDGILAKRKGPNGEFIYRGASVVAECESTGGATMSNDGKQMNVVRIINLWTK